MVDAPERIWLHPAAMTLYVIPPETNTLVQYVRADIAASQLADSTDKADAWDAVATKNARIANLERQLAEARAERDTLAMHLEAKAILAKRDNARLREALSGACDQILDSYRTWVADDLEAHPKQGQIPRYDAARAALAGKE